MQHCFATKTPSTSANCALYNKKGCQGTPATGGPCHRGLLSQGSPVTGDPCHKISLQHGTPVTRDPCHMGPLSIKTIVTKDPCHMGPMSQGTPVTGDPCHRGPPSTLLDIKNLENTQCKLIGKILLFKKHYPHRWGPNFFIVQSPKCGAPWVL